MASRNVEHLLPVATCTKCGMAKTVDNFSTDRAKPRGRDTQCKSCTKERDADKHLANKRFRDEAIADGHKKECRLCGSVKLISGFSPHAARQGGSSSDCIQCTSVRHKKWRLVNVDHVRKVGRSTMRKYR